jgi:tetrahydromethanopterin S-methyltransferase subunit D
LRLVTAARVVPIVLIGALVIFRIFRRSRPQPVRPRAIAISTAILGFVLLLAIVGSAPILLATPLGLALAPVALAAGCGLGWLLVRTVRFYPDQKTGELWMRGDVVFIAVILATILLRLGVQFAAGGPATGTAALTHPTPLRVISTDLIFLSAGMWLTRGVLLLKRHSRHQAQQAGTASASPINEHDKA